MLCVLFSDIFNSKVVYHQGKTNGPRLVRPESRRELALVVSVPVQPLFQQLLRDDAHVREALHAFHDLYIKKPFRIHLIFQLVVIYDILWEVAQLHSQVFYLVSQVECSSKILDVYYHKLCAWRWHNTVEQKLDG